jgi:hypothetical protein
MGVAGERLAEPGRADTGVFVGEGIPVLPVFPQLSLLFRSSCPPLKEVSSSPNRKKKNGL